MGKGKMMLAIRHVGGTMSEDEVVPQPSGSTLGASDMLSARTLGMRVVWPAFRNSAASQQSRQNPWLGEVLSQVVRLAALPDRWDGGIAHPPAQKAIREVIAFVASIPVGAPMPDVRPGVDGSVAIEWVKDQFDLTVDVLPDGSRVIFVDDGNESWEAPVLDDTSEFERLLWRFSTL